MSISSSSTTSRGLSPRLLLAAIIFVQVVLVSYTFPLGELASDKPLTYIDNPAHWYRIVFANNISDDGLLTGYDPFFNAGTMAGIAANPAAKVPAIIAVLVDPWLSEIQVWKIYVFLGSIIAALCVPVALILLRAPTIAVALGGIFGLLLWWVSVFRWYHTAGMASFVLSAYLAVPYVAWVARYLIGRGSWLSLIGLGLFGMVGLYIHPLFALPIALWSLIFLAVFRGAIDFGRLLPLILVVPAISVGPSLLWLIPVFFEQRLTVNADGISHQSFVGWDMILLEPFGVWERHIRGSRLYPLLLLGAGSAIVLTRDLRARRLAICFVVMGTLTVLYAGLGATFEAAARFTQPNRFAPVAYLFLTIPAAFGGAALLRFVREHRGGWPGKAATAVLVICAVVLIVNLNELRRELSRDTSIGHYGSYPPEVRGVGPYTSFLSSWLKSSTNKHGRVLFEVSRGRIHDNAHIAGFLAYTSDREFIGGHYPDSYFADFVNGNLFGTRVSNLDKDTFDAYAELYNLGWVVAFSPESKAVFDRLEGVVREDKFREISVYRIDRPLNFFWSGEGRVVKRGHNSLVLDGLSGGEVILKYHFMHGLVAEPAVAMQPVNLMDDPNPFIRLIDPPGRVEISLR